MPSVHDDSPGSTTDSSPRRPTPETPGENDPLATLAAASQQAADRLVASIDWDAHDAAMSSLAAEHAALHHLYLLHQQDDDGGAAT